MGQAAVADRSDLRLGQLGREVSGQRRGRRTDRRCACRSVAGHATRQSTPLRAAAGDTDIDQLNGIVSDGVDASA
jgi:hypothetical protein